MQFEVEMASLIKYLDCYVILYGLYDHACTYGATPEP